MEIIEIKANNNLVIHGGNITIPSEDINEHSFYSCLMDYLGDYDVVSANEINQNYIACECFVYELTDTDVHRIENGESVELSYLGKVSDLADTEFNNWYYNL